MKRFGQVGAQNNTLKSHQAIPNWRSLSKMSSWFFQQSNWLCLDLGDLLWTSWPRIWMDMFKIVCLLQGASLKIRHLI